MSIEYMCPKCKNSVGFDLIESVIMETHFDEFPINWEYGSFPEGSAAGSEKVNYGTCKFLYYKCGECSNEFKKPFAQEVKSND